MPNCVYPRAQFASNDRGYVLVVNKPFVFTASEHALKNEFPLTISHWKYDAASFIPMHSHDFIEAVFVMNGSAQHLFQTKEGVHECTVRKGDIFLINPGEEHTYRIKPGHTVEVVNMLFFSNIIDWPLVRTMGAMDIVDFFYVQPFLPAELRFGNILNLNHEESEQTHNLVKNLEREFIGKKTNYKLLVKLLMTQLFVLLSRKYTEQKHRYNQIHNLSMFNVPTANRVLGYLERHYAEDIKLADLAFVSNCSERQLTRIFKENTGVTIINYLHRLRVEKAKDLLLNSDRKVSDICFAVGFNDMSYFIRVFKKISGNNPTDFRNRHFSARSKKHEFVGTVDMD